MNAGSPPARGTGGISGAGIPESYQPVPARFHRDGESGAAHDEDGPDGRASGERTVDDRLQRDDLAASVAAIGRHDDLALGILDPLDEGRLREPGEHHRVDRAESDGRQHGGGELGNHR